MRKIIILLVAFFMVLILAVSPAAAVGTDETGDGTPDEGEARGEDEAPESILTPDSPFYFLKRFIENVRLLLTFDQEKKIALLDKLAQERAKELEALENMYAEGELSDRQLAALEKALDDLIYYTARLVDELMQLENDAGAPENGAEMDPEENNSEEERELDKCQWRIAHLQEIAERAPEAAQMGLARAVVNAERQRERAIARGKLPGDETEEVEEEGQIETSNENDTDTQYFTSEEAETKEDGRAKNKPDKPAKKDRAPGPPKNVPGHGFGLRR